MFKYFKNSFYLSFLFLPTFLFAQSQPPSTKAATRLQNLEIRKSLGEKSLIKAIPFESIGPSVFGGRVVDVEVNPKNANHFYVAYASGGLWETKNNGHSFSPLFDNEMVNTIGDIAVDWKNDIIWIGTGENNSSRSSYAGIGMYYSKDKGKSWTHTGLTETQHIGRIILHPTDPNILWVAALGHLYSKNKERGIYKTIDGGKNWNHVLYVNDNAGGIDLIIHPDKPSELYAGFWERSRRAWNFQEAGTGSGIYKSLNGGENWENISGKETGFPSGEGLGRIGLSGLKRNGEFEIYTIVDNQNRRPPDFDQKEEEGITKDELKKISVKAFLKLEEKTLDRYLKSNKFPKKYSAYQIKKDVKEGKLKPADLAFYTEDGNSLLFDTPVIGAEIYKLKKDGKWTKTHEGYIDDLYYSYGYYFGQIRVAPSNPDHLIIVGVPILLSKDGGKTFKSINGDNVHVDHHSIWINPSNEKHIILGNDGGINITYDQGETWVKCNTPAVGQFYSVAVDNRSNYRVYGGTQDNGVWMGPNSYESSYRWYGMGAYPYDFILGGDGMQVAIDDRDPDLLYTGYQFGHYFRINTQTKKRTYITPKHELGDRPYRWNWQSPIHLSKHHQDIVYFGANRLFRSFNQGDDFTPISPDLTTGGKKGDVPYGTLSSIHESPLQFGKIFTGSDDGKVFMTPDGGVSWQDLSKGLPQKMWVSRIQASNFEKNRVFLALNGYRWDDFSAYLYLSNDNGQNWEKIGSDLPHEPINVVKEDPKNENILYVGTDQGLYISLNRGKTFMAINNDFPSVPVHDLVVHPEANDLIVGTHGRSIYKANVTELQMLADSILSADLYVFEIESIKYSSRWGNSWSKWSEPNEVSTNIGVFSKKAGQAQMEISFENQLIQTEQVTLQKGLNYLSYDLTIDPLLKDQYQELLDKDEANKSVKKADNGKFYIQAGKYQISIRKGKKLHSKRILTVKKP